MNERREPRFKAGQSVWITLFGEPDIQLYARIRNLSAHGIGLELLCPVATGAALKINLEDWLILGEVIFCRADKASYYVGVELEQALCGLAELAQSLSAFSDISPSDVHSGDMPSGATPSGPQQTHPMKQRRYQN
jgi:hypothetical protein